MIIHLIPEYCIIRMTESGVVISGKNFSSVLSSAMYVCRFDESLWEITSVLLSSPRH